MNNTDYR